MKELIKKSLAVSAIIIATVFGFAWIFYGYMDVIGMVFMIMLIAVIVVILQSCLHKIPFQYYLLNIVLEYISICAVVLVFGICCGWFSSQNWWSVPLYVGIVYVSSYFLELITIKKDLEFINNKLTLRNRRRFSDNEKTKLHQ